VHYPRDQSIAAASSAVLRGLRPFAPTGTLSAPSSATTLVTDEVLHPIGKIQPLLIGLNLPDQVESSRSGWILPIWLNPPDQVESRRWDARFLIAPRPGFSLRLDAEPRGEGSHISNTNPLRISTICLVSKWRYTTEWGITPARRWC